jgi:hypothetical protein
MMIAGGPGMTRMRDVPLTLRLRLLFGGAFSQFGWLFFGFGMFFVWVFLGHSEVATFWKFIGPLQRTPGVVTQVEKTGAEENDSPVYAVQYTYQPPGAQALSGTSYVTGTEIAVDTPVTVEYQPAHLAWSRAQGMRAAEFDWVVIFVLIFPAVGLGIFLSQLLKGRRTICLLRYGLPAFGVLTEIAYTNIEINHQPLFRLHFQFTTHRGQTSTATYSTCDIDPSWQHLIPGQDMWPDQAKAAAPQTLLLYLPANPRVVCLLREFGDSVSVDGDGIVQDRAPWSGLLAGILPLLAVAGNVGWLLRVVLQK